MLVFPSFLLVSIVCIGSTQQHVNNFWGGCLLGDWFFGIEFFVLRKTKHPENLTDPLEDVVHEKHLTAQEPEKHPFYKWLAINFYDSTSSTKKMVLSPCSIHLKNMVVFGVVNLLWCFKWNGRNTEVFAATWFQAGRGAILKKRLNPLVRQVIPRYTPVN